MTNKNTPHRYTLSQKIRQDKSRAAGHRAAQEILLLCTTAKVSPKARVRLSQIIAESVDWRYLLDLATFHGIVPLVTHNLVANGFSPQVPQPYMDQLKHGYNSTLYRNIILSRELVDVLSTFSQYGINAVTLKGTVLAEVLYGNPALRPVVDMDILVHPTDIPLAGTLLTELGYKKITQDSVWDHPFHEAPYCKEGSFPLFLELHWALEDKKLATFPEEEIWRRTQPLQLQGTTTLVLSPEDNLLFMANHLSKHDFHLLKFLGDITELLKKYEESLDWDYITKSACAWQIAPTVYYALRRAKELLGAPVQTQRLEALKPSAWRWWLIDFLADQETFVSSIRGDHLRSETAALVRSLMMSSPHRMLAVLSKHRGLGKKGIWIRNAFWIMWVFVAGLGRYRARVIAKRGLLSALYRR